MPPSRNERVVVFKGADAATHDAFQSWRTNNPDGFNLSESRAGRFTLHWARDAREHPLGRGCMHQGGSGNRYLDDKDSCYTAAAKVCSNDLQALLDWVKEREVKVKPCSHCDSRRFPFPIRVLRTWN